MDSTQEQQPPSNHTSSRGRQKSRKDTVFQHTLSSRLTRQALWTLFYSLDSAVCAVTPFLVLDGWGHGVDWTRAAR
eukprot:1855742-Amphidinium_carterae.1